MERQPRGGRSGGELCGTNGTTVNMLAVSLSSRKPCGKPHLPSHGGMARWQSSTLPSHWHTAPTTTLGF
eukprot:scaffold76325_cov75-Phaeocystis_antarctica.AAC.2